jgi:hypothetical protein
MDIRRGRPGLKAFSHRSSVVIMSGQIEQIHDVLRSPVRIARLNRRIHFFSSAKSTSTSSALRTTLLRRRGRVEWHAAGIFLTAITNHGETAGFRFEILRILSGLNHGVLLSVGYSKIARDSRKALCLTARPISAHRSDEKPVVKGMRRIRRLACQVFTRCTGCRRSRIPD